MDRCQPEAAPAEQMTGRSVAWQQSIGAGMGLTRALQRLSWLELAVKQCLALRKQILVKV